MNTHAGEAVEKVVRRQGFKLTELAQQLNVNRRTLYNWFRQPDLSIEIVCRIGSVIRHDFSKELPEAFQKSGIHFLDAHDHAAGMGQENPQTIHYWMNKYIDLLEKYNHLLDTKTTPAEAPKPLASSFY